MILYRWNREVISINTILNKNGESTCSHLIPAIKGNVINFPSSSMMLDMSLPHLNFVTLRHDPSIPGFFRVLAQGIISFPKSSIVMAMKSFSLHYMYELHCAYFTHAEPCLHTWNEIHLIIRYWLLSVLLNSVCKDLIDVHQGNWYIVSFVVKFYLILYWSNNYFG